jgi:hypothetical protein
MSVCFECCVLSGRGLCDELITRSEESYRMWCVVVCGLETSWMRRPWPTWGCCAKGGGGNIQYILEIAVAYEFVLLCSSTLVRLLPRALAIDPAVSWYNCVVLRNVGAGFLPAASLMTENGFEIVLWKNNWLTNWIDWDTS